MKIIIFILITAICFSGTLACGAPPSVSPSESSISLLSSNSTQMNASPAIIEIFIESLEPGGIIKISVETADFSASDNVGAANGPHEGHMIYYMDEVPYVTSGKPSITSNENVVESTNLSHSWDNVPEGLHTFSVQLVNNDGTPLFQPVIASVTWTVTRSVPSNMATFWYMWIRISPAYVSESGAPNRGSDVFVNAGSQGTFVGETIGQPDPEEPPREVSYYKDKLPSGIPNRPLIQMSGTVTRVPSTMYTWHNVQPGQHTFSAELVGVDGSSLNPPQVFSVAMDVKELPLPPSTSGISGFTPPLVGEWRVRDGVFGSGVAGKINGKDYLFAVVNGGIMVFDLQNHENPIRVAYLKSRDSGSINGLTISGTVLYASTPGYLWIINVSRPSKPKELSKLLNISPSSMAISGNYAYICQKSEGQIRIIDVSNPAHPKEAGSYTMPLLKNGHVQTPSPVVPFNLKVSGSTLFVLDSPSGSQGYLYFPPNGLHIIDISSPLSLKYISYLGDDHPGYPIVVPVPFGSPSQTISQPGEFWDIAIVGGLAYVASGGPDGMLVLDISNPAAAKEIANVPHTGSSRIQIVGNMAFLAAGGLAEIVDISDPNHPKLISDFDTSNFAGDIYSYSDFIVEGNYIYFLVNSQTTQGIKVLDVSALSK